MNQTKTCNQYVMKAVIKKELRSYFSSPIGYIFLVIFLFSIGYITFEPGSGSFFLVRQADLSAFFRYLPWPLLVLIPAMTMKFWAEEQKTGTIELLLTLPITIKQAVLSKFFAGLIFITLALILTFPMVITVFYLGTPDFAAIIVGYFGALLLGASYLAIGSFFSAMTKNQVVSFILSVAAIYILLMAGSPPVLGLLSNFLPTFFVDIFEQLSLLNHFEALQRGVIRLGDLWYYSVLIAGLLYANIIILEENKGN